MCGEDGMKRAVYNMKEKHAERDRNIEKNTKNTQEKSLKTKELYLFQRKTDCNIGSNPSINARLNLFTFKEVNLVLEHPRSTNYIVWAFNIRTQYYLGVVTNLVLTDVNVDCICIWKCLFYYIG